MSNNNSGDYEQLEFVKSSPNIKSGLKTRLKCTMVDLTTTKKKKKKTLIGDDTEKEKQQHKHKKKEIK